MSGQTVATLFDEEYVTRWRNSLNAKTPKIIFVDGCDGTGKTTLLVNLEKAFITAQPDRTIATFRLPEDTSRCSYRSIIKQGPRKAHDSFEHAFFDLEDAFLNIACFVNFLRNANAVLREDPDALILCDRSMESIDCYQQMLYGNKVLGQLMDTVRAGLREITPTAMTFILKPPIAFVQSNLTKTRDGLDPLDTHILNKTQAYMNRYRNADAGVNRYVLRNPDHYVHDIFSLLGAV